jgi:hypothetical protein
MGIEARACIAVCPVLLSSEHTPAILARSGYGRLATTRKLSSTRQGPLPARHTSPELRTIYLRPMPHVSSLGYRTPASPAHLAMYIFKKALNSAASAGSFFPLLLVS